MLFCRKINQIIFTHSRGQNQSEKKSSWTIFFLSDPGGGGILARFDAHGWMAGTGGTAIGPFGKAALGGRLVSMLPVAINTSLLISSKLIWAIFHFPC